MARTGTAHEALGLSRCTPLPASDVQALAALIMLEIESQPDLPAHVRGALIRTAADFANHGRDCEMVESQMEQLLDRMGPPCSR